MGFTKWLDHYTKDSIQKRKVPLAVPVPTLQKALQKTDLIQIIPKRFRCVPRVSQLMKRYALWTLPGPHELPSGSHITRHVRNTDEPQVCIGRV